MDLETENRIAAALLKEAAELRRQSEREGVLAYLRQPTARGRPNSRFLTATVLGVQQANRVVEVNEMWRVRQKEQELDDRLKRKQKDERISSSRRNHRDSATSSGSTSKTHTLVDSRTVASCSSSKRVTQSCYSREDEGLRDEEIEEFLHARAKRGRGAVGSRMDETGPYLPHSSDSKEQLSTSHGIRDHRVVIGPVKPSSLRSYETSSEEEEELHKERVKKARKSHSKERSHKHEHRSKEKSRDKKKERRSKNR